MKSKAKIKRNVGQMAKEAGSKRFLFWIAVAAVIHIGLIGATSAGYIGRLITGESTDPTTQPATQPADPAVAQKPLPPAEKTPANPGTDDEAAMLEAAKNSAVVKSMTETAKPEERPTGLSDEGMKLDE